MNALRHRPLAVFSIVFYISACFFAGLGVKTLIILAAISAVFGTALIFLRKTRIAFVGILVLFSVFASSLFSLFSYAMPKENYVSMTGEKYIIGTVTREYGYGKYIADAEIDGNKVKICLDSSVFVSRGDTFKGDAKVSLTDEKYCKNEGVYLTAVIKDISIDYADNKGAFYTLNNRLASIFADKLGRSRGGFASSVLLGNRKDLSPNLNADLKALGLSHLIALSGLHLTVICGIVCLAMRPFGKKAVLTASMITSVFYMMFTDMSPSIVRSAVMLIIFSTAFFFKRDADVATTVGTTALIVTLISPTAVFDLGFQLSLSAVAGVRCSSAYLEEKWYEDRGEAKKLIFSIISPFAVGFGATIFTLAPLLIYYGTFTWVGAVMTVPMSLLLSLIMWMLPPLLILPFDFYIDTVSYLIGIFEKLAELFSDMGEFILFTNNSTIGAAVAMCASLGFVLALCAKRKLYKNIIFAVSAALVITLTAGCAVNVINAANCTDAVFNEAGDGDVLTFKSGASTLTIDVTSGTENACITANEAASALGDSKIDALIIADPHSAHYNALTESGLIYAPDVVYLPEEDASVWLAERIDHICRVVFYKVGDRFVYEDMSVEVLPALTTDRSKISSLAFSVTLGNEKTVYLGSSYIELGGEVPHCHRLYLGSYGPVYKKSFTIPPIENVISSSKAEKYLTTPLLP